MHIYDNSKYGCQLKANKCTHCIIFGRPTLFLSNIQTLWLPNGNQHAHIWKAISATPIKVIQVHDYSTLQHHTNPTIIFSDKHKKYMTIIPSNNMGVILQQTHPK